MNTSAIEIDSGMLPRIIEQTLEWLRTFNRGTRVEKRLMLACTEVYNNTTKDVIKQDFQASAILYTSNCQNKKGKETKDYWLPIINLAEYFEIQKKLSSLRQTNSTDLNQK
jgi:hypothetical protein